MHPFTFGIYPGSAVGVPESEGGLITGPPDRPELILQVLNELQPTNKPFMVRAYVQYIGNGQSAWPTPDNALHYVTPNRKLDLVLCYRTSNDPLDKWVKYIREIIQQYGDNLTSLQITEEANSKEAGGDAVSPDVRQALVTGIIAAKKEIRRLKLSVWVGFSTTPIFDPNDDFWPEIGRLGGQPFVDALDYVALDFFPDVFVPLPPTVQLSDGVRAVLHQFRYVNMAHAAIPFRIPILIGENGWPTSPTRPYDRQAQLLEAIIRAVYEHRETFNVRGYSYFNLRDTNSENPYFFHQFGLLKDDYSPKPAYEIFKTLVAELSE
ncbi:hypothetical protein EXU85_27940 [Spirosoma sp. KCTC 42546]|uniref:hypothetical protein n=1 Tax=Spirosoma sp. KCTC 42546 TaxID=2520506 RepID=UPI0011579E93|nr:hypothetical protein [Spirosoma sp. KCTC 42546]QDK82236.1 hypothetical protein EXU85_27940 [Spirosoma sp. KCTC 42546]